MAKRPVYTLGHTGVVIDPHPIEPTAPGDGLLNAQNATHDPKAAHAGALRKRPGLERFNPVYAGGAILGGIMMPVAGTGGAPQSGGGSIIGTSSSNTTPQPGTGNATGAPGATFDGGSISGPPNGASLFGGGNGSGGGTQLFGGKRLIAVGRLGSDASVSNEGGSGWYVSSQGLADVSATTQINPGPPVSVYSFPPAAPFLDVWGTPGTLDDNTGGGGTIAGTTLYYAAAHGNQVSGAAIVGGVTVHKTNGKNDSTFATIPLNPFLAAGSDGATKQGVTGYSINAAGTGYTAGDTLTFVGGTGSAANIVVDAPGGTINNSHLSAAGSYTANPTNPISLSGGTGSGAKVNATFGSTAQRSAIECIHFAIDGNLYVGVKDKYDGQDVAGSVGRVFRIRPVDGTLTEWNTGNTPGTPAQFNTIPYCVNYFAGYLFIGEITSAVNSSGNIFWSNGTQGGQETTFSTGGSATNDSMIGCLAQYNGRLFAGTGINMSSPRLASFWSKDPASSVGVGAGWTNYTFDAARAGNTTNGNLYTSMVVFQGNLYLAWYAPGAGAQIYKVAANSPGNPSDSTFTITTAFSPATSHYTLFVDQGFMYAIGVVDGSPSTTAYVTQDGVTWTNKSASLPLGGNTSRARFVLYGMNQ